MSETSTISAYTYELPYVVVVDDDDDGIKFGNSLNMSIRCMKRQRNLGRSAKSVVAGTSQGDSSIPFAARSRF